jgi:serine/threonine protein kinase
LPLGGRFQGYDIESILGVGGMSIVYRVRHHFLGRVQALKVLKMQHTQDKELRELALREALALARIQHTNLVSVTDAGLTDDGIVWMVMPLLEGCTLRDYMIRTDLPLLEALRVAVETCDGVFSAHEHGIVHRDVKPENVFITKTYQVVVLDLGMAKFVDFGMSTTGKRRPVGTVRYMSPEQLLSERVDTRTDVYAIGMMLYEMIARHPFELAEDGVTRLDKMQMGMAHIHREPPALRSLAPSCPPAIAAIVHRAIAKDREQRFASVQALAGAIRGGRAALRERAARASGRPRGDPAAA